MDKVNARTTAWLTATFLDKLGVPSLPSAVSYRVDCATTRRNVRALTNVAPAASVEIQLTSDDTAILNRTNKAELRKVTVVAEYTSPQDQATAEFEFEVVNVPFGW